jgi:NAD(P)-dependent dehydrogenase (short-subunit alcohol dehydrogenase family)
MALNGTRALITGGNRRLGLEIAKALSGAGARVAFTFRGEATRATPALSVLPPGSQAIRADLADLEGLEGVVMATEQALGGPLDILVNGAALFEYDTLKSVTASSLNRHLQVNVTAAILLTRFVTRHPSRDAPGVILNILDYKIHNPFPDFLSYTLTKYTMYGFTQVAARDLAPNWRVCAIAPGYTLAGPEQSPEHFAQTHDSVPLKRGSTPADIGQAAVYLAAAQKVTAQILTVDGGAHMLAQDRDFMFCPGP